MNNNLTNHLEKLIDKVFKILPLYEDKNLGLLSYVESLIYELNGLDRVFDIRSVDSEYRSLLSTLETIADDAIALGNSVDVIRSEVFKCLSIINTMKDRAGD